MALSARAQHQVTPPNHGTPCFIGKVYAHYADKPEDLAELNALLYEEGNTQQQVYDVLVEFGDLPFKPAFQTINKHRGKACRCFRHQPFRFCGECKRDLPSCICDGAA